MDLIRFYEELKELVEIDSGSQEIAGVTAVQRWIVHYLQSRLGSDRLQVDWIQGSSGKAQICHIKGPRKGKPILLCGHSDTVYPFDEKDRATISKLDKGLWKGKGILDMKAGLLMACYLAIELTQSEEVSWDFVINGDEEIGSPGSKGYLEEIAKNYAFGLVFEPCFEDGSLALSRGASGYFKVEALGKSAHVGRNFQQGRSAIAAICSLASEIEKMGSEEIIINLGKIEGGTALNVVSAKASIEGNIRCDCEEKIIALEKKLQKLCGAVRNQRPGIQFHISLTLSRPARKLTEEQRKLNTCLEESAQQLQQTITWKTSAGVCDGNNLSSGGLAVLDNVGPGGFGIHSDRETLDSTTIQPKLKLLRKLIERVKDDPKWFNDL